MSAVVSVNRTIPVLGGRHILNVLTLRREPDCFSMDYTLTPPLPGDRPGGDTVFLWVEATDDLGTVYGDGGGARGLSEDATHTRGVVSAQPELAPHAREIKLEFVFLHAAEEHRYELAIPVG
ncbi:hypothetical protein [Streptosporangium sp. NPDC004631]